MRNLQVIKNSGACPARIYYAIHERLAGISHPVFAITMPIEPIKTPCIKVCAVDGQTGYCLGCGRTLPEIGRWVQMGPEGRDAVIASLPARIERLEQLGKR
ncbi:MAG: DUF1289 domain-containing protein [Hyphomonas sp.]|nr:DUF1289 domain-containing protein [Hyphomonas sp.]